MTVQMTGGDEEYLSVIHFPDNFPDKVLENQNGNLSLYASGLPVGLSVCNACRQFYLVWL